MRRRKYYYNEGLWFKEFFYSITIIYLLYLTFLFFVNRVKFWQWLVYGILVIGGIVLFSFLWQEIKWRKNKKHLLQLLSNLENTGMEEYLINFINRFGLEKKGEGWTFRNYKFDWDRINDLKKILYEKGVISKDNDVFDLLRFYIQKKEEQLTRESIKKQPQKFESLTGEEFEKLLYRLFEAMGYKVEWIGKTGDQGGDLIANKSGERILIQAKCYRDRPTGNEAVQQVVGAMNYYDCNKTMVVTTSYFTDEAIALAKANNVELISKEQLQEMLLKYLGESWS